MPDPTTTNQIDPSQTVEQTVTTPELELFSPKPSNWQLVGDALARRHGLLPSLLGGFMSDYGQRKTAKETIPALEDVLKSEGSPLTPEQLHAISGMDPRDALQQLSIWQKKALEKKAAEKAYEPKLLWDPHADNGKGSMVEWHFGQPLTGLQTLGEHARQSQVKTGTGEYADFQRGFVARGGNPADAPDAFENMRQRHAVSKVIEEKNEAPLNDQAAKWYNGTLQAPPPEMTRREAFEAGYRPITSPQQIENMNRLASAYTDLTSPAIQRSIGRVLRPGPLATEMKSIGASVMRDPDITNIRNFNTNLLQLVNPTFSKTLRVNTQELEMLKSYFIKLPEGIRSPTADTDQQARAKIRNATALINRILRRNGVDPAQFKSPDEAGPLDNIPNDKRQRLEDAIKKALSE